MLELVKEKLKTKDDLGKVEHVGEGCDPGKIVLGVDI